LNWGHFPFFSFFSDFFFVSASSFNSIGTSHFSMNAYIFLWYFSFMYEVLAGFSAFKKMAKSLSMVSLTVKVGYFRRLSPTSLRPRVTIDPNDCSRKVMLSSVPWSLTSCTGSSAGGIFTGSWVSTYFEGSVKKRTSFSSSAKT